jgi:hypothetical protein
MEWCRNQHHLFFESSRGLIFTLQVAGVKAQALCRTARAFDDCPCSGLMRNWFARSFSVRTRSEGLRTSFFASLTVLRRRYHSTIAASTIRLGPTRNHSTWVPVTYPPLSRGVILTHGVRTVVVASSISRFTLRDPFILPLP